MLYISNILNILYIYIYIYIYIYGEVLTGFEYYFIARKG